MTNETTAPFPQGTRIGILGGGQLGRLIALAAAELGMRTHIYCPDPHSPAFEVTPHRTVAAYEEEQALAAFADAVDVITYEFENVPARTAEILAARKPLRPGPRALAVSQDRLAEKAFLTGIGVPVAPYAPVTGPADGPAAIAITGLPAILKTTRLGYDGKGQKKVDTEAELAAAIASLAPAPFVLEQLIPFEREISVVIARAADGQVASFDPAENVHRNHILKTSTVPGNIPASLAHEAKAIAARIAHGLDYIGVLGVEFFVVPSPDGPALLVNEIAPRVHNSGHWTQHACATDQFAQHVRAILGWPLADPARHADVVMENLIGDEIATVPGAVAKGALACLYGKTESRPGRKMGHLNWLSPKSGTF